MTKAFHVRADLCVETLYRLFNQRFTKVLIFNVATNRNECWPRILIITQKSDLRGKIPFFNLKKIFVFR